MVAFVVSGVLMASVPAAERARILMGNGAKDPAAYARDGFNCFQVKVDVGRMALCEVPELGYAVTDSAERKAAEAQRAKVAREIAKAETAGLDLCVEMDELKMPIGAWNHLRKLAPDAVERGRVDLADERVWTFHRAKVRDVLSHLPPSVRYVMVRTGENYPSAASGNGGQTIARHGRRGPETDYARDMARIIEETRRVVVDEFHRTLVWRTWDLGNEGLHANPEVYDRVMSQVKNRAGLVIAIKYVQTDFWSYNDFNPCIGRASVPTLVEIQGCREYEGKGAYPNYMGFEHGDFLRRLGGHRDIAGYWVWGDRAGGAGGPFTGNKQWVRLNVETTLAMIRDPRLSPERALDDWCRRQYGPTVGPRMARIVAASHDCVRGILYVGAFAENHRGWKPHLNITRDDTIGGGKYREMETIYAEVKDRLEAVFAEKRAACEQAARMRREVEALRDDPFFRAHPRLFDETLSSFLYLEKLGGVFATYVEGMFRFYAWREDRTEAKLAAAKASLAAWRTAWQDYRASIPKLPGAATPYRSRTNQKFADGGMEEVCTRALEACARP